MTETFKAAGDDYSHIMVEALADRLAEVRGPPQHRLVALLMLGSCWSSADAPGIGVSQAAGLARAAPHPPMQALAERLHELVRREVWGYAADESMSVDDMLKVGGRAGGAGRGWLFSSMQVVGLLGAERGRTVRLLC